MATIKSLQRTFRPTPRNQQTIELAEQMSVNVSKLINSVLEQHMRPYMKKQAVRATSISLQRIRKGRLNGNGSHKRTVKHS
jgi:hypothetical protein